MKRANGREMGRKRKSMTCIRIISTCRPSSKRPWFINICGNRSGKIHLSAKESFFAFYAILTILRPVYLLSIYVKHASAEKLRL